MADTTNYTHFDISRYLNHEMTKTEMHDFEKAMMEDPFLADAFEGYEKSDADVATIHLAQIEKELTIKEEKAKVVAMPSRSQNWWKVAALIIILIAGAGTVGYKMLNNNAEVMEVASNKAAPAMSPEAPAIKRDTIGPVQKPLAAPQIFPAPSKEVLAKAKNTSPVITEQKEMGIASMEAPPALDSTIVAANAQATLMMKKEEMSVEDIARTRAAKSMVADSRLNGRVAGVLVATEQREFKGRVVDPKGEPLGFATIHGERDKGTVADANGYFKIKAPDSVLDVSVVVVGYGTTRAKLKSNTVNEVLVDEKAGTDLAEVVVTALGRKKKDSASFYTRNIVSNKAAGIEPVKGWEQFHKYIVENLQHVKDTSDAYMSGDVVLEFDVDKEGRPSKIKALEGANEQNAVKAIELLQNGPKWKRKRNTKGKVVVIF
jgi:hypothetical protein